MATREEIREGIEKLTEDRFRSPAEDAGLNWDRNFNRLLAKDILAYLHSQGVVIKVEGELPDMGYLGDVVKDKTWFREGYRESQQDMLKAGYVATEPLIEVELKGGGINK